MTASKDNNENFLESFLAANMSLPVGGRHWRQLRPGVRKKARDSLGRLLRGIVLGSVCGGLLGGCGGPTGQFYVVQNQVPSAGCVVPADKGAAYLGEGTLDVRVPPSSDEAYVLFPLLQNDLPAEGGGGVEPNRIALSRFEVDLRFVDGPAEVGQFFADLTANNESAALVHYQSPWSGSLAPAGGTTAAVTNAFPAETARRLRDSNLLRPGAIARVEAMVRAVGTKLGATVRSDVFAFPIRVCDGCLINSIISCPATGPVLPGGICNPAQDAPVDCCTQGTELICPAATAS